MDRREFWDDCNKEIRRMLREADKKLEEEEKERIYDKFRTENNIEMIVKALTAFKMIYDGTVEEWDKIMIKYEHTPTGESLKYMSELFHLFSSLKYEVKREVYYNLCKIIGDEGYGELFD